MSSAPERNLSTASQRDSGPAQPLRRARVLDRTDLLQSATAYEFEGDDHGAIAHHRHSSNRHPGRI